MKAFLLFVTILVTSNSFSQTVFPDPGFGQNGIIRTNILESNANDERKAVLAIQPDGKIIVAIDGINGLVPWIIRINPDGSRDNSFNSAVLNKMDLNAMLLQDDGKIVIAGSVTSSGSKVDFAIARLNNDGTLDNSFGTGGKVISSIGAATHARIFSIDLQQDNKIVAAGYYGSLGFPEFDTDGLSNFALARYNTDGSLDSSFGLEGKLTTDFPQERAEAYDVIVQEDGKIVAVGLSGQSGTDPATKFAVARYNNDGSLDNSFSGDGMLTTTIGAVGKSMANAVIIQPDGKIVAVGSARNFSGSGNYDFALVRYNDNGSLDIEFNGGYPLLTDFAGSSDYAFDLILTDDGKIILGGNGNSDVALARYNSDGSPDMSFDADGKLTSSIINQDFVYSIVRQSDDKIIAGGYSSTGTGTDITLSRYNPDGSLDPDFDEDGKLTIFMGSSTDKANAMVLEDDGKILVTGKVGTTGALIRYLPGGDLDFSFGVDGKVIIGIGVPNEYSNAVAVQNDGKILIAGIITNDFAIWRYNPDGNPDLSFGDDGKVITAVSTETDIANAIAIQNDGKIITAGYAFISGRAYFALVRYNSNGGLDNSFGSGGIITTDFDASHAQAIANTMSIQSDGKIVVAGYSGQGVNGDSDFALARYNTNGILDLSFNSDGLITTSFGNLHNHVASLVIQNDGKIIAIGSTGRAVSDIALARYNIDGSLDNNFGSSGVITTDFGTGGNQAYASVIQPDGKILVAGSSGSSSVSDFAFARYNIDGSLDNTFDSDGKLVMSFWENYDNSDVAEEASAIQIAGNKIYVAGTALSDFVLIVLQNNIALPLKFLALTAAWSNDDVLFQWKTSNEENTASFDIERSINGSDFTLIGNIASANSPGEHHYSFPDRNARSLSATHAFYRLKQKDIDGRFTYSSIVAVIFNKQTVIKLYPNPAINKVNLALWAQESEEINWRIVDNAGNVLQKKEWMVNPGNNNLMINVNFLTKGVYYLVLEGKTIWENLNFIKQ